VLIAVSMSSSVVAAALLGLATAPHCMGMCGPIAASCSGSVESGAAYQLGRLSTYAGLGAVAAALMAPLRDRLPTTAANWAVAVLTALALLVSAYRLVARRDARPRLVPVERLTKGASRRAVARGGALGVVTGLLPCGSLYGALAVAAVAGSSASGAATMVVFGVVSGAALALTQVASRRLVDEPGQLGRSIVAGALVAGALLSLGRPWLASSNAPPCHDAGVPHATHSEAP